LKTQLINKNKIFEKLSLEDKMTIGNAIEEQIKWLESNPDATINQLKIHKSYLEDIITSITDKLQKESEHNSDL
jgi:hypothetical protein